MYLTAFFKDHISKLVVINVNTSVVVIPYSSIKNFAIISPIAPITVVTMVLVDNTVPRSLDLMLW